MKPGMCFHLYTTKEFTSFIDFRKPSIYRSNFDKYLLKLFYQFKNVENGQQYVKEVLSMLLSPPNPDGIKATIKMFRKLKLLESDLEKDRITSLGECFSLMDLDLQYARMFLTGAAYEIEQEILADIIVILTLGSNLGPWFKVRKIPDEFKDKYINKYGDIIGLYHIYLDYRDKKLPEEYERLLETRLFKEIDEKSTELQESAVATSGLCINAVEPKKQIRENMYLNLVSAFLQSMPENVIKVKDLDLKRYPNTMIDLAKEKEVLALSRVTLSSFGTSTAQAYDNFLRIISSLIFYSVETFNLLFKALSF